MATLLAFLLLSLALVSAQAPAEICVGVVLPITGERNVESLRTLDAIRLGAEDANKDPTMLPGTTIRIIDDPLLVDSAGYVQFGPQRMYDQVINRKCANGTSPIAIIGDLSEAVCHQMAPVATLLQIPMISPGARDPSFSSDRNANAFTMVFRSSLGDEAEALKAFIKRYGWTSFVLWHTDSSFGTALTAPMTGSGLEMVDVPIPATDQGVEMQRALTRIMTLRFRIIVVHMEDALAKLAMNLSNRAGLLNGDYIFLGSMQWTYGSDTTSASFNEEEKKYMQGVIGLGLPIPSASAMLFAGRLAGRNPLLYPPYFAEGPINTRVCGYDAITAIATAVKNLTLSGLPYTGKHLMRALVGPQMNFNGITGNPVAMTERTGSRVSRYQISNFQNGAFTPVGMWSPTGLVMTPGMTIVWPGMNTEERPGNEVPRRNIKMNSQLPVIAVALAVVYGLGSLLLHYLIYINTAHEVIKASSPIFCHIILGGGDVAYLMSGLSALSMDVTCSLVPSMIAICFSLIFGALLAKTYRIHRIFNSSELRIKTPTNTHLFAITGALVFLDLLAISIWMGTDKPQAAFLPSPTDVSAAYQGCVMGNATAWTMALFMPKALVVVVGAWLAYKVKDLNHNFNEAKYISLALYNVLLLSAILFGLVTAFPYAADVAYILKSAGSATVAFLTMLILFAPKFWDVYITKDWIEYHSNSSYVSGVLVHKSSKGSYAKHVAAGHISGVTNGQTTELGPDGKPLVVIGNLTNQQQTDAEREKALINGSPGAVNRRNTTGGAAMAGSAGTGGKGSHSGNSKGHGHHQKRSGGDAYVVVTPSSKTATGGNAVVGGAAVRAIGQSAGAGTKKVVTVQQGRSSSPSRGAGAAGRSPVAMSTRTAPPPAASSGAAKGEGVGSAPTNAAGASSNPSKDGDREGMVTVTIETPLARPSTFAGGRTDTFTGIAEAPGSVVSSPITRVGQRSTSPLATALAVEASSTPTSSVPLLPLNTAAASNSSGAVVKKGISPTNASDNGSGPNTNNSSPALGYRPVPQVQQLGEASFSSSSSSLMTQGAGSSAPGTAISSTSANPGAPAPTAAAPAASGSTSGGRSPMAVNAPILAQTTTVSASAAASDAEAAAAALPQLSTNAGGSAAVPKPRAEASRTVANPYSSYPSLHLDSPAVLNAPSMGQAAAAIAALQAADRSGSGVVVPPPTLAPL